MERRLAAFHQTHAVGQRQEAVEAVLGDERGEAPFAVQPRDGVERDGRAVRVQLRGWLVEQEQARAEGDGGGDGHALAFPAGERGEAAFAQVGDGERAQGAVHAGAHLRAGHGALLEREGHLVLHAVGDGLRLRILEGHARDVGERARGRARRVQPAHGHAAREASARELRHEPVEEAQEGRFPPGGGTGHDHEASLADLDIDAAQGGAVARRVGVADALGGGDGAHGGAGMETAVSRRARGRGAAARKGSGQRTAMAGVAASALNSGAGKPAKGL